MASEHPKTVGRFEVLEYLGTGATGRAYRVRDPRSSLNCVVQLVDPDLVEQAGAEALRQEIAAIATISHPNVTRILEVQLEQEPYYITTEYARGTTLRSVIDRRRLTFAEALRVFKDLCAALKAIHTQGVVHHALSPHCIVVAEGLSSLKVTSFALGPVGYFKKRMTAGETLTFDAGPLSYLAPEHVRDLQVDPRSDIYSAGVILYECLTGAVPAGRFNLPSQQNGDVPPELDPIVLRCLSSDPGQRYANAQQLLNEIRSVEEKLRLGLAQTIQAPRPQHAPVRPMRLALLIGLLLLLIVAALVGVAAWRHAQRPAADTAPVESSAEATPPGA